MATLPRPAWRAWPTEGPWLFVPRAVSVGCRAPDEGVRSFGGEGQLLGSWDFPEPNLR